MPQDNNKQDALSKAAILPARAAWAGGNLPQQPMERDASLAELWLTLWKRRHAVMFFTAGVFLLAAIYCFWKTPVYESVARIHVDPSQQGGLGVEQLIAQQLANDYDSRLQTQVQILQSNTVSMQVIKDLDLAHKEVFAGKNLASKITETDPLKMNPRDREELLRLFADAEGVSVVPKTQMIRLSFRSTDPKLAAETVNTILQAHLLNNFQRRYEGTQQVAQWLSTQLQELKTNTADAQRKLADFQKKNNILVTSENSNLVVDRLTILNQHLADAEMDRIVKEARYRMASTGNPELVAAVVPSTTLKLLRTQEADLKNQLAQLDAKFGSGYPKVREMREQLNKLDKAITEEVQVVGQRLRDEFQSSVKSESLLRGQFEAQKQEAFKLNESSVEFATLKHEVESSQTLYDTLQLKLKEAGVAAGLASADINIVDRGQVSGTPVLPKTWLVLALALGGGLFGGMGLAYILESMDASLQTSEDVEEVSSLPALAVIPWVGPRGPSRNGVRHASELAMASIQSPNSPLAEGYRTACSSLLLSAVDVPPRFLVITSALPGEGKSITSCNLAVALARRGSKVLLVDGDMRRSSIHIKFGIPGTEGLSSILSGKAGAEAIQHPMQELPNLAVLPTGPRPPSPTEMLASNRLGILMDQWTAEYDHVIFDTAPLIPVADTMALATRADAVILTVMAGKSRKKALSRIRDLLHRANARIAGVIVNGADMQLERYYSYGYGYGYGNKSAYGSYYDAEIKENADEKN